MDMAYALKGMKITAGIFQLCGLVVASRIDLKSKAIEVAEAKIPGNPILDAYNAAKTGAVRVKSPEEMQHRALEALHDPASNTKLFKWSVLLVGAGMLIQLLSDLIE